MVLVAFALYVRVMLLPHVTDDAYITYRYVDRWLAGDGLTFNDGEWVEGFSNPLWLFLVAGLKILFGLSTVGAGRILGLVCFTGVFAALGWLAGAFPKGMRGALFWFATAWLLLSPGFQIYATLGLEGPLLTFLLVLGVAGTVRADFKTKRWPLLVAAVSFGLIGITRPEGLLYGALWGILLAVRFTGKRSLMWLALLGFITLLPAVVYEYFRVTTYHLWVPNTAIAKPPGIFRGSWLFDQWGPWVATLLPVALLWMLAIRTGDWPAEDKRAAFNKLLWAAGGPILAGLIFNFYTGPDWMGFGRFIVPFWPLVVLIVAAGFLIRFTEEPRVLIALAIFASAATWQVQLREYIINHGFQPMLMRGTDQVTAGQWLAETFPSPRTVALGRLGAVGYYGAHHVMWDLYGLTDSEQALFVRKNQADWPRNIGESPVMKRKPDIVIVASRPLEFEQPPYAKGMMEALTPGYVCLKRIAQGNFATLDFWLRKDLPSPVKAECRF